MPIRDNDIEWIRRRLYVPVQEFTGLLPVIRTGPTAAADSTSGALAEGPDLAETVVRIMDSAVNTTYKVPIMAGMADGIPALDEIGSTEVVGLRMDTNGDSVSHRLRVPCDVDPGQEMGVRVNWTSGSSTVADTVAWIVLTRFVAEGVEIESPASALNTTIASDNVTGSNHNQWTSRGIRNSGFLTRTQVEDGASVLINVEMDAKAAGLTEALYLLGIEIDYAPLMTRGGGADHLRFLTTVGSS